MRTAQNSSCSGDGASWAPRAAEGLVCALILYASSRLGSGLVPPEMASTFPAHGIAVALLLLRGNWLWPFVGVASFGAALSSSQSPAVSILACIVATLAATITAHLARRVADGETLFSRSRHLPRYMANVAVGSSLLHAFMGSATTLLTGSITGSQLAYLSSLWWLTSAMSVLIVTPAMLVGLQPARVDSSHGRTHEAFLLGAGLIVALMLVFGPISDVLGGASYALALVTLPIQITAALRFGLRGAVAASAVTTLCALWGSAVGHGPFGPEEAHAGLLALQTYLVAQSTSALAAATVLGERDDALRLLQRRQVEITEAFDAAPARLAIADAEGCVLDVNGAAVRALGCEPSLALGINLFEFAFADEPELGAEMKRQLQSQGGFQNVEAGIRAASGEIRTCLHSALGVRLMGEPRIVWQSQDITDQRRAEQALERSEATYRTLFTTARDGIVFCGMDGSIEDANQAFLEMLGYELEELRAIDLREITPVKWKDLETEILFHHVLERGYSDEYEKEVVRKNGEVIPVTATLWLVRDELGRPKQLQGILRDITEQKRIERKIRQLAFFDGLTGLPNRQLFRERLAGAILSAQRREVYVGLLFLDLDRFKHVNDTLGHSAGDQLLREVARRFLASVRASDVITRTDSEIPTTEVSRLGGDEFTVLLSEMQSPEDASGVARRLLEAINKPVFLSGQEVFVSTSIGIAVYPNDGLDAETLIQQADAAMYHAKTRGRNNFQFYDESMNLGASRRFMLEGRLRRCLENEELALVYQPQRDAFTNQLTGVEALLRWESPESGTISPSEFIPIAEESGLILPIGDWLLESACRQVLEWQAAGFEPVRMSVNISSYQFRDHGWAQRVQDILARVGLDPHALEIEITESTLMQDDSTTRASLLELRDLGIGLALDDFGTGYSSLSYLRRFALDRVKIDRSFVGEITTNESDASLVAAIVAMAQSLDLKVVAEGVETLEQAEMLRAQGCNQLQGYLIGRPVPPGDFERFLERSKEPA